MFLSLYVYLLAVFIGCNLVHGESLIDSSTTKRLRNANTEPSTDRKLIFDRVERTGADVHNVMMEALEALVAETILSFDPSQAPTSAPSDSPSHSPSTEFSIVPSHVPSTAPTRAPVSTPVVPTPVAPPMAPTIIAPVAPPVTGPPTITTCPGLTEQERISQILAILDAVADPDDIRDNNTPQGLATTWIIAQDGFDVCPDYPKLVQRWTLAVMYFSTNGENWFQCSASPDATDTCGSESPFEGKRRFLSSVSECEWAGISCINGCVTEVEYGTSWAPLYHA